MKLLSIRQAAGELGCSTSTVRGWVASGALASIQFGRRGKHWIAQTDLDQFVAEARRRNTQNLTRDVVRLRVSAAIARAKATAKRGDHVCPNY